MTWVFGFFVHWFTFWFVDFPVWVQIADAMSRPVNCLLHLQLNRHWCFFNRLFLLYNFLDLNRSLWRIRWTFFHEITEIKIVHWFWSFVIEFPNNLFQFSNFVIFKFFRMIFFVKFLKCIIKLILEIITSSASSRWRCCFLWWF